MSTGVNTVVEEIVVDAPVQVIYDLYADLDAWPTVLPDVIGVEVRYNDGYNQEFSMTVDRPGGPETVRGIRYCRSPRELEMCQFDTPPMLSRMSGRWTFEGPEQGPTTVRAERRFAMRDPGADAEAFAGHLRGFLRENLRLFGAAATTSAAATDAHR